MWQILKFNLKRESTLLYSPQYWQIAKDINTFEPQLMERIITTQSQNEQWALQALVLLDQAKKYLKEFKIDKGSKRFQFARRCEIYGMDDRERLAYAKSIYREAEKFNEWRKDSIANLLCVNNLDITEAPAPEFLVQAVELKEEYYNNQNLTS